YLAAVGGSRFRPARSWRKDAVFLPDQTQLLAMPIISEGLDDVGTGPQKIAVQPYNGVGMIQNGFWNESAGLPHNLAAPARTNSLPRKSQRPCLAAPTNPAKLHLRHKSNTAASVLSWNHLTRSVAALSNQDKLGTVVCYSRRRHAR